VVIESLAVGTPVLASRIGCYPEMITDGESGALFPTGDVHALMNRLRELEAKQSYRDMRLMARRRFEAEFTGERNLSIALSIYRDTIFAGSRVFSAPASLAT
jgi:glycosyltransferase involved in cell wall biosynthesis